MRAVCIRSALVRSDSARFSGNRDARSRAFFLRSASLIAPVELRLNSAAYRVPPVDRRSSVIVSWLPSGVRVLLSWTFWELRCGVSGARALAAEDEGASIHLPVLPHHVYSFG